MFTKYQLLVFSFYLYSIPKHWAYKTKYYIFIFMSGMEEQ